MKQFLIALIACASIGVTAHAQEWQTNFDDAKKIAAKKDMPIILVFQGSDWCAPCIKLDKEVWSTETFQEYAKDHYILLKADFPRKRKNNLSEAQQEHNAMLAEKFNQRGTFPLVVVLDKSGKRLGETGYKGISVEAYIAELNTFIK